MANGKCDLWAKLMAQTEKFLRDEIVERTLLNHMGLSSNLCSETSCATLDKSLILFNS